MELSGADFHGGTSPIGIGMESVICLLANEAAYLVAREK